MRWTGPGRNSPPHTIFSYSPRRVRGAIDTYRRGVLMAVEIRVFLAIEAFRQKSGTGLACAWTLFLSPAKQVLDSKCKAFGIGLSDAGSISVTTVADAEKRVS